MNTSKIMVETAYQQKDMAKAKIANKFIGIGAVGSSTEHYAENLPQEVVNCGEYTDKDVVFVSMNGNRRDRISIKHPILDREIQAAIDAGAAIVADTPYHRGRNFNVGERELEYRLMDCGYTETIHYHFSIWRKMA